MIDALKTCFPEAKIDFLVNKRVAELIFDHSNINKVHAIEKESEISSICKENSYDLAIVVSPKFEIAWQVYRSKILYRLGTRNRWYSFLFNIRHAQHRKYSIKNEMEYNLDMLKEVNCNYLMQLKPVLKVKNEYIDNIKNRLSQLKINNEFLVIHIPTLGSAKVWSDDNFAKLIDLLGNKIPVVLTGTPEDRHQILKVVDGLRSRENIYPITDISLNELAALLKLSKLFIGNSSGPIHIAAAVGTYVIGLYSPVKVESPVRWVPVTDNRKIFVPEKDDNSRDVMDDINPEEVAVFVKEYFAGKI